MEHGVAFRAVAQRRFDFRSSSFLQQNAQVCVTKYGPPTTAPATNRNSYIHAHVHVHVHVHAHDMYMRMYMHMYMCMYATHLYEKGEAFLNLIHCRFLRDVEIIWEISVIHSPPAVISHRLTGEIKTSNHTRHVPTRITCMASLRPLGRRAFLRRLV